MTKDGTGRSNALPILQLLLGAALGILGLLEAFVVGRDHWIGWVFAAAGAAQILSGIVTIRRNQRLDRAERHR